MMTHMNMKWLKKRHFEHSLKKYLLLPEEQKEDDDYHKIFQTFDDDQYIH